MQLVSGLKPWKQANNNDTKSVNRHATSEEEKKANDDAEYAAQHPTQATQNSTRGRLSNLFRNTVAKTRIAANKSVMVMSKRSTHTGNSESIAECDSAYTAVYVHTP